MNRFGIFLFSFCITAAAYSHEIKSPDGNVAVSIELDAQGVPFYSVTYEGKAVVNNSLLGFELIDGSNLKSGF